MDEEQRLKMLLEIDYNKLLSYLAGVLVFLFMMFQMATEKTSIPRYLSLIVSLGSLGGICFFLKASYSNYEEIIRLENRLGLSEFIKPSGTFSQRKKGGSFEREISPRLKILIGCLFVLSLVLFLYNVGMLDWLPSKWSVLK